MARALQVVARALQVVVRALQVVARALQAVRLLVGRGLVRAFLFWLPKALQMVAKGLQVVVRALWVAVKALKNPSDMRMLCGTQIHCQVLRLITSQRPPQEVKAVITIMVALMTSGSDDDDKLPVDSIW